MLRSYITICRKTSYALKYAVSVQAIVQGTGGDGMLAQDMDRYAPEPEVHKYLHSR